MSVKSDTWIRRMAQEHRMIEPFVDGQVREGVISYGLSSYGYDIRISDEFKIFTNVHSAVVDPKHFNPKSFVDFRGDVCVIPPNSFVLAQTVEYFRIPRQVITPVSYTHLHRRGHCSAARRAPPQMRVSAGGSFAGQARSPLRIQTPPVGIARHTVSATEKLWRQHAIGGIGGRRAAVCQGRS